MERFFSPEYRYSNVIANISEFLIRLPSFVFFIWLAFSFVQLSDRAVPAQLYDGAMETVHPKSGEPSVIRFTVDRHKVCRVTYNQVIYDSAKTRFTLPSYVAPNVGRNVVSKDILKMSVNLPRGMAPGKAIYYSERQYFCNWTHYFYQLYSPNPPVEFTVE